ncbi:MAG: dehydrogenase [Bacteroidales bacterium]|nr:dehydrogenase [Bacteroidales bacterium]MDY6384395.1 thiamine pyrophosphate-dependent enzyme [Bacteroidales bacterium]
MPKSLYIDPEKTLHPKEHVIKIPDIPVMTYDKTVKQELKEGNFTEEDLLRIYRDMSYIREFETMLNLVKTTGGYNGVPYNNPGPAHLSAGQEAAAVGMAYTLDTDDFIFGSHRSHGEILAKGLRSIQILPDAELKKIMEEFWDGATLKVAKKAYSGNDVKELGIRFLLYGAMAEIFARVTGFNKGLGGSMHTFFTPFGIYPNNAIVGGSGAIAVGAALYKKVNRKKGIVVANLGDGAMGRGPVLEGMTFATMDQFNTLWEGDMKGGLPVLFNIMDNQYAMGGQTNGETEGWHFPARLGAGFKDDAMAAERVNGYDPLAVIDAFRRKKQYLLDKKGPALLDVVTYRYGGHSPSDQSSYRTKEEIAAWEAEDSIVAFGKKLIEAGVTTQEKLDEIRKDVNDNIFTCYKLAIDFEESPRMDLVKNDELLGDMMFSNGSVDTMAPGVKPDVLMPMEENPRVKQIAGKVRFYKDKDGKEVSKMKTYNIRDGIFEAIIDRFYKDASLIAYGEENREWGGAFAVYRGLTEALPFHRLFNSPISEAAIIGTSIGYAMCGGRVIPEIMYCDFITCAGDEIFNQLPKWQAMSGNILKMPVVVRVSVGSKYGAQHSQDFTSLCAHIPGLKVCFPVTPYDAKGLMNAALQGTDPVIFFESQRIYDKGEMFHEGGVPEGYYEIPLGEPDIKRPGKDVTFLTIGATLYRALEAADMLKERFGMEAEVIDARSLVPFNYDKVLQSVKKTGRIIISGDACARGSFLNDLASNISEMAFDYLDAAPVVLGSRNWITPCHELEESFFPQPSWFLDAINEKIVPLKDYVPTTNQTEAQAILRAKRGV